MQLSLRNFVLATAIIGIVSAAFHGLGLTNLLPWHITYSDTLGFSNTALSPGVPYIGKQLEYPVLTGLFLHLSSVLGQNRFGYYFINSLLLILLSAAATYLLYELVPVQNRRRLLKYWIFAPTMLVFMVYNWDILPVFFSIAAFYFFEKQKPLLSTACLAFGFGSKFYPAIYLIPLLLHSPNWKLRFKVAGIFAAVTFVINIFFALKNFNGWWYFFALNSTRNSNPDSIWTIFRFLFGEFGIPTINFLSLAFFAASFGFVLWKYKDASFLRLCFLGTLLFLIFNKVFSPQYLLWLLPFYILLDPPPPKLFYTLEASNFVTTFLILRWFLLGQNIVYFYAAIPFVLLRHLALIAMFFRSLAPRGF